MPQGQLSCSEAAPFLLKVDKKQKLFFTVKDLHTAIATISHIQISCSVLADVIWTFELTISITMATKTIHVLQLCVQYLNFVISTITHVQFVIDDLDKTGFTELSCRVQ